MDYKLYIESLKNSNESSYTLKYLPFIVKRVGRKYHKHFGIYKFHDLLEVAIEASLKAEKRFDASKGLDFSTYARYDIDGDLDNYISQLTKHQKTIYKKVVLFIEDYIKTHGVHPSETSILKGVKISKAQYNNLLEDLTPPQVIPYIHVNQDTGHEEELGIDEYTAETSTLTLDILKLLERMEDKEQVVIKMVCIEEDSIYKVMQYLGVGKSETQSFIDKAIDKFKCLLEANDIRG